VYYRCYIYVHKNTHTSIYKRSGMQWREQEVKARATRRATWAATSKIYMYIHIIYILYIYVIYIHIHVYIYMEWHLMAGQEATARATRRATWAATVDICTDIHAKCILYLHTIQIHIYIYIYIHICIRTCIHIYVYGMAHNGAITSDREGDESSDVGGDCSDTANCR